MIKKSRKQFVPDELKDDKYWARRRKNNIAAKRSRDARRQKENQIAMRARYLEKEVWRIIFVLINIFEIYKYISYRMPHYTKRWSSLNRRTWTYVHVSLNSRMCNADFLLNAFLHKLCIQQTNKKLLFCLDLN